MLQDDGTFMAPWSAAPVETPDPAIVFGNMDVWFCSGVGAFAKAVLQASDLKWFQSSAAGLEHPMLRAFGEKAQRYTNGHGQAEAMAEWVIWAGLDFFQGGPVRRATQTARKWDRHWFREIAGTHWLIVGFGAIGQAVARRLKALGAEVTGVRRSAGANMLADAMIAPADLHTHLPRADAVLLCCPITDDTRGLASAEFFAAMKDGALFLNVGRGGLVDEAALLAGLDAGRPAHAALDVVSREPLPEDHPIWAHPNITLTPHTSGWTLGTKQRTDELFLENLAIFLTADGAPAPGALHFEVSAEAFAEQAVEE